MTKRQKEGLKSLEVEINRLFDRMDQREFMMAKAEMEGNTEMIEKCKKVLHDCKERLAGIDSAINYLGYRRELVGNTDQYKLVEF